MEDAVSAQLKPKPNAGGAYRRITVRRAAQLSEMM